MSCTKNIYLIACAFFVISCTHKISNVTYNADLKNMHPPGQKGQDYTSAFLRIEVNTYKGFFEGRESFLSFKKNYYYFEFNNIDTFYTEKNVLEYSHIPKYLRVEVKHQKNKRLLIKIDIKDDSIPDLLKGEFILKYENYQFGDKDFTYHE